MTLLELDTVTRRFGGLCAVDAVSLSFEVGGTYCIIGPNGAGKSTLANIICGTVAPNRGRVLLDGVDVTSSSADRIARLGVARKYQVPSLFGGLSVIDNLTLAAASPAARHGRPAPTPAEILAATGLGDVAGTPAGELAHGHKQWLEIGIALVTGPKAVLLDEPSAGLGVEETLATARMIEELSAGATVIAIEHDMRFVSAIGGEVIVLHRGAILSRGTFDEVRSMAAVQDVYLGRATG